MDSDMVKRITAHTSKRSPYCAAHAVVSHVVNSVWPHYHVVAPVDRYRPYVDTVELRTGRKKLIRVMAYIALQVRRDMERE